MYGSVMGTVLGWDGLGMAHMGPFGPMAHMGPYGLGRAGRAQEPSRRPSSGSVMGTVLGWAGPYGHGLAMARPWP